MITKGKIKWWIYSFVLAVMGLTFLPAVREILKSPISGEFQVWHIFSLITWFVVYKILKGKVII